MAVAGRTSSGLAKFRALRPGSRVALVAPASPFDRASFDAGCAELMRLGFEPVFDSRVFDAEPIVAGPAAVRAASLTDAWMRDDVDAVMAVRGGYGSMELLPLLDAAIVGAIRKPFVGYSDTTSLHLWLNGHVGVTSVHGPMIAGRLAIGEQKYDRVSLIASLGAQAMGEVHAPGLETIRHGEGVGPLVGGNLTQIGASLGTPYAFQPPARAVLFLEDVNERPYRLRRLLVQLRQSGRVDDVSAFVFGEMVGCDEPDGRVTARSVIEWFASGIGVPVVMGFPSGHTTSPSLSLPFGVRTRVVASGQPCLVFEEAAAE